MVLPSSRRVLELALIAAIVVLSAACSRSGLDLLDYGGTSGPPSGDSGSGTTPMSACMPPAAGAVATLASSPYGWWTLAVDSTDVYAIAGAGGGNVVRVSLCGGAPVTLAEANAQALAIDATNVYWTDSPTGADITVKMVAKTGGTQTVLAKLPYEPPSPAVGGNGMAVDSSAVYVLGEGNGGADAGACSDGVMDCGPGVVIRIPLDGSAPTTLATEQDSPTAITVDATHVYWVNFGPRVYYQGESMRQGTVVSAPLTGGSVTTLATGQYEPQGIGVQGSVLYWVGDNGGIVSMLTSGGPTQTLMADDLFLEGVVADAEGLYLVDASGAIEALPLTGGMPTTIASANASYNTGEDPIVVDATSLYWRDGNDLLRAAK